MTAAAVKAERGFSTPKIYYPEGGKSVPGTILTDPESILARITDLTADGHWTSSPASVRAQELALAIGSLAAQHAAATGNATVGNWEIEDLLTPSLIRGLGIRPELDTLYADGIITRAGNGRVAICGPAGHGKAETTYPGFDGEARGLRHVPVHDQQARFLQITERLAADGLPDGIRFADDIETQFTQDRKRGDLTLPAWAWAVIFNQSLTEGEHPVSRRTAANRLAELRDSQQIIMTRVSRTRLDLRTGVWHTTPSSYALPRPGLQGVVQRFRARVRNATTKRGPSEAWRLQAERWRWRDLESGWGA